MINSRKAIAKRATRKKKKKNQSSVESLFVGAHWQQREQRWAVGGNTEKTLSHDCCGAESACPGTASNSRAHTYTHTHIKNYGA